MDSDKRPKMTISNRAKQFAPFDALKGFREALKEAGFSCVEILGKWGATCLIKANK